MCNLKMRWTLLSLLCWIATDDGRDHLDPRLNSLDGKRINLVVGFQSVLGSEKAFYVSIRRIK